MRIIGNHNSIPAILTYVYTKLIRGELDFKQYLHEVQYVEDIIKEEKLTETMSDHLRKIVDNGLIYDAQEKYDRMKRDMWISEQFFKKFGLDFSRGDVYAKGIPFKSQNWNREYDYKVNDKLIFVHYQDGYSKFFLPLGVVERVYSGTSNQQLLLISCSTYPNKLQSNGDNFNPEKCIWGIIEKEIATKIVTSNVNRYNPNGKFIGYNYTRQELVEYGVNFKKWV